MELEAATETSTPTPKRNPIGKKRLMDSALRGITVVGVAGVTFIFVDPALEKKVQEEVTKDSTKEIEIRNKWGLGALLGGIGLGIGGFYLRPQAGIVGDALVGAGAGLGAAGAVQLSVANKLKKARRVMA